MDWIVPTGAATEPAASRVAEALERIERIGQTPGSLQDRYQTAGFAILRFAEQARAWHQRLGSIDLEHRVHGELDALERAIAHRLSAPQGAPGDTVAALLRRLVESFPRHSIPSSL